MHTMSLAAVCLLFASTSSAEIDKEALRAQAVMPSFDLQLGFTTIGATRALRVRRIVDLQKISKPTGHQLFQLAEQREELLSGANTTEKAEPDYLFAIGRLKVEAKTSALAESELARAYQAVGRDAIALTTAQHLLKTQPKLWLSYSTLGAVRAKQVRFDSLTEVFKLIQGDLSNEEKLKALRSDKDTVAEIRRLAAVAREAHGLLAKGIQMAPANPTAYKLAATLAVPEMITGPLELMVNHKSDDISGFSQTVASPFMAGLDLRRQAALLSTDVIESMGYLGAVVTAYGMLASADENGATIPGLAIDVPLILSPALQAKVLPVFEHALKLSNGLPGDLHAVVLRDLAPLAIILGDLARAPKIAAHGVELTPAWEQIARLHVDLLILTKQYRAAAQTAEKYAGAHPDWTEILYRGAKAFEADKDIDDALRLTQALRSTNPGDTRFSLAEIAFRMRDAGDATAAADALATLQGLEGALPPGLRPTAGLLQGIALGLQGKHDEAKATLLAVDVTGDPQLASHVSAALRALR